MSRPFGPQIGRYVSAYAFASRPTPFWIAVPKVSQAKRRKRARQGGRRRAS